MAPVQQHARPAPSDPRPPRTRRITGVDVARSVAIIGMLVAHLGTGHDSRGGGWGEQWMWIFDGRSSALFATLAGVSLALMSRSTAREDRPGWRRLRVKIAVRAVILLVLGVVLQVLGTPVVVILTAYAVMFLMALPVLRLGNRWLLLIAGVAVTLGPVLVLGLRQTMTGSVQPSVVFSFEGPVIGELVTGYYPALVWIGYLLVGVVVGRGALASRRYAAILLGGGTALAAIAYGLGTVLTAAVGQGLYPVDVLFWPDVLLSVEPHSNSAFEVAGNIGVGLAVVGLCLLLTSVRAGELALSPLAALGAMSLTIYSAQLVVIAVLGPDAVYYPGSNVPLLVLALASIAFSWGWRAVLGQGPLERLLKISSDGVASLLVPTGPR
ncbi:putative membrane protein [Serinibacter arcticus]|uniref:Putative membrane protein n=1 Tax=Serinibacter arcticus TaxID=1655435 RepID=A0A4Z1E198_9MICO|nr:putative membrane protein [Serinibacter arcticus]